jgi:hypothetical protein
MPDESQDQLAALVTRGLASIQDQLRERDTRYNSMSESMIGLKFQVESMAKSLAKMEADIVRNSTDRLTMRVEALEKFAGESDDKQKENVKWLKGLFASVLILLLGVLFNFIRINLK